MKREDFDYFTNEYNNLNTVKKACFVVKEYQRCETGRVMDKSAVTYDEYQEALKKVLAYAFLKSNKEEIIETWKCNKECVRYRGVESFCPGEFQIDDNSNNLCKWYSRK